MSRLHWAKKDAKDIIACFKWVLIRAEVFNIAVKDFGEKIACCNRTLYQWNPVLLEVTKSFSKNVSEHDFWVVIKCVDDIFWQVMAIAGNFEPRTQRKQVVSPNYASIYGYITQLLEGTFPNVTQLQPIGKISISTNIARCYLVNWKMMFVLTWVVLGHVTRIFHSLRGILSLLLRDIDNIC